MEEETPTETPFSKSARTGPHKSLAAFLEHVLYRLRVIDKSQVYLIDSIENPPPNLSVVKLERAELEAKGRRLLNIWSDNCEEKDYDDSERASQSNIVVNNIVESMKKSSAPSFGSAKFRRLVVLIAIIVGGSIVGIIEALRVLRIIK